MKKKLEADLISIAHRVLKIKNKSDIVLLHQETQKLYEKLSVLRFWEENYEIQKPAVSILDVENKIEELENEEIVLEKEEKNSDKKSKNKKVEAAEVEIEAKSDEVPEVVNEEIAPVEEKVEEIIVAEKEIEESNEIFAETAEPEKVEEVVEEITEVEAKEEDLIEEKTSIEEPTFKPDFDLSFDLPEVVEEKVAEPEKPKSGFVFDDFLGADYKEPEFVKPEDNSTPKSDFSTNLAAKIESYASENQTETKVAKGLTIGLNDRVAFMKHLFANNTEDYNRVLSQLITFDSFDDAKKFIDTIVKPDYNEWTGKEDYETRFLEIIEKKFS